MISYPLLWQSVRETWKQLLLFAVLLTVYAVLVIGMYDPQSAEHMRRLFAAVPEGFLAAAGLVPEDDTLTSYVAAWLFGFLMLVFPMVFEILAAHKLVASKLERGSMVYLVGTPNSRKKIAFTQAVCLEGELLLLMAYMAVLGTVVCERMFPGQLRAGTFHDLCIGALALHTLIAGFAFFASCAGRDRRMSALLSFGVPFLFFVLHVAANAGGRLTVLKYATFFTLFDMKRILAADMLGYVFMGILAAAGLLLYAAGILLFRKRDLSI